MHAKNEQFQSNGRTLELCPAMVPFTLIKITKKFSPAASIKRFFFKEIPGYLIVGFFGSVLLLNEIHLNVGSFNERMTWTSFSEFSSFTR